MMTAMLSLVPVAITLSRRSAPGGWAIWPPDPRRELTRYSHPVDHISIFCDCVTRRCCSRSATAVKTVLQREQWLLPYSRASAIAWSPIHTAPPRFHLPHRAHPTATPHTTHHATPRTTSCDEHAYEAQRTCATKGPTKLLPYIGTSFRFLRAGSELTCRLPVNLYPRWTPTSARV